MLLAPIFEGFVLGASLIIAIGAQNAFVLKQGLKRQHLFLTAITCFLCDSVLIVLGVEGIGALMEDLPMLVDFLRWGGAIFLVCYGIRSFYSVFHPHALVASLENPSNGGRLATLLALLGFTLLNPHTYVDTFLLLGTVGAEHPLYEHAPFITGALMGSFVWFFSLTYGASRLSPIFKNPRAWQILDTIMGVVMIGMAISLIT